MSCLQTLSASWTEGSCILTIAFPIESFRRIEFHDFDFSATNKMAQHRPALLKDPIALLWQNKVTVPIFFKSDQTEQVQKILGIATRRIEWVHRNLSRQEESWSLYTWTANYKLHMMNNRCQGWLRLGSVRFGIGAGLVSRDFGDALPVDGGSCETITSSQCRFGSVRFCWQRDKSWKCFHANEVRIRGHVSTCILFVNGQREEVSWQQLCLHSKRKSKRYSGRWLAHRSEHVTCTFNTHVHNFLHVFCKFWKRKKRHPFELFAISKIWRDQLNTVKYTGQALTNSAKS